MNTREKIADPASKRQLNEELFTTIAPRYDLVNRLLSLGADARWKDRLVAGLGDMDGPRCLDLACGTGDITFRLGRRYPGGTVTGLDITEAMTDLARRHNTLSNVEFAEGDMCDTGFADETFDVVTGGYALRNAPDLGLALDEIWRVLKPGGVAAFLDFSKPTNRAVQAMESAVLKIWAGAWGLVFYRRARLYTYIAESLRQFPDTVAFKKLLAAKGFSDIHSKKHYVILAETVFCRK